MPTPTPLEPEAASATADGWHPAAHSIAVGVTSGLALGKPKERVEQVNEEPEELAAMRAMTPEARRILLQQMNEAERQARSSSEH
jgi:hypothetical protein